jgi:hypothetical protein
MNPLRWLHASAALIALTISAGAHAQDVEIKLLQFGVGSNYRAGELTGIQLELTSRLPETMQVWAQWDMPNADGDIAECGRSLALMPGRPTQVWLYAPLPPPPKSLNNQTIWTVRVYEERDERRRGELAATRISPALANANFVPIESGMIAVVGASSMGLEGLDVTAPSGVARPVAANEPTRIVRGITPAQLPDRWDGLKGFEAVAWSHDKPQELRADQAEAIKQYVRNGGHLIINLPQVGDPWSLGLTGSNELDELLPARSLDKVPRRDESVPVKLMLPILSKGNKLPRDIEVSIRVFKDLTGSFDAIDNHYEPLIALPDGRVVVVRRTYGQGFVTVIGIELSSQLTAMGLPQADAFWNRILGRRADTPTAAEVADIDADRRLSKGQINEVLAGSGIAIEHMIALSGEASRALLLALVLFGAYWLLAGPLGFAILRRQKLSHHSWVAFLVATALFTAIAWGSVSLLRSDDISVKHVTFLDYIARPDGERANDPQLARAVSWLSVYLNKYGPVQIGLMPAQEERNLLLSWPAPRRENQPFPNVDRYTVDVGRDPTVFSIPARSTTAQFYANWRGPLDRNWGGMIVADPRNPVSVNMIDKREHSLAGTLTHQLPGTLTNVIVLWIKNDRVPPRRYQVEGEEVRPWVPPTDTRILNNGEAWVYPSWDPDTPLDLSQLSVGASSSRRTGSTYTSLFRYLEDKYKKPFESNTRMSGLDTIPSDSNIRDYFEMLSMYNQLTPPEYQSQRDLPVDQVVVTRDLGRELDLSVWFTRPCLIVIGRLENSTSPVPLRIEGGEHMTSGLTIVRWVYPLPLEEEIAFSDILSKDVGPPAAP